MATTPHSAPGTSHDAEHVPGTMDTRVHERTFEGFVRLAAWSAGISLAVLVFLALTNA